MPQEGIFQTTAFGGFDKKSVLSYIDQLTEGFQLAEQEYQKQLEGFSKAQDSQVQYIQKMETQLSELEEKLEVLASELEKARSGDGVASQAMEDTQKRIAGLEADCRRKDQLLAQQQEMFRQMQFKMEAAEFKSKKYDEISGEVGDALLAARQTADQMTRQTRQDAELLLQTATQEADELREKARQDAKALVEQARAQALEQERETQTRVKRFYTELGSFKSDSARLRKSIEEILFVLNDRIDVMQEVVGQVEKRCSLSTSPLEYSEEEPFKKASDDAGLFGGVLPEDDENT